MPWELTGNPGTDPTVDYVGKTDGQPLVIRTEATERLRIDTNGNLGIGTTIPAATLDVAGGLLHVGGSTAPATPVQGAYLGWNALTGGTGETDFINNRGLGTGGCAFMNAPGLGNARTTLMVIGGGGNVGIGLGIEAPSATLSVVQQDYTELAGTARSRLFLVSGGPIPPWTGNVNDPGSLTIASFGATVDGLNNVSLGVRAIRNGNPSNPRGWPSVDLVLSLT